MKSNNFGSLRPFYIVYVDLRSSHPAEVIAYIMPCSDLINADHRCYSDSAETVLGFVKILIKCCVVWKIYFFLDIMLL